MLTVPGILDFMSKLRVNFLFFFHMTPLYSFIQTFIHSSINLFNYSANFGYMVTGVLNDMV